MNPQPTRPRISRQSKLVLVVAGVAGLAIALWLTFGPSTRVVGPTGAEAGSGPSDGPASSNDPREAVRAEVPEALAIPPDSVTPGTRALAPSLPLPLAEVAAVIAKAREDGILTPRPVPGIAYGVPRMAGELADALSKKTPMQASSFELATLLGGIVRARGGEVEYAVIPNARFDATELLARRFAVRLARGDGAWVAPDGGSTEGAVLLSDLDLLGYVLAYRALGASAKNDVDTASRAAGLARRLLPDDPAIAFVVAETQALNGLLDEARRTFETAAETSGGDAMTWYRLGQNARAEERPFKADEYFKKSAARDASFAAPHVGLAELALERLDVTPKDEHPAIIEAARQAVAAAEKADPDALGIRVVKAHLAGLEGDDEEGRALLEEEVRKHPEDAMSFVMLANVYAAEQRDDDALQTLEAARAKGHETPEVLEGIGALYAMDGRFAEAVEVYAKALELDPDDPGYRVQLAQLENEQGHAQRARQLLGQQLERFPQDAMAPLLLAQLELAEGQPDKARLEVARVLAQHPHNKEAILLDYFIGAVTKKVEPEARKRALAVVGTRRQLAEMLLQNGLVDEAEVNLKDALTEEPDDLVAPVLLVAIYTATNRQAEASALREATLGKLDASQRAEVKKLFEEAVGQALQAREPEPLEP